jgi:hypothetical protein
MQISAKQKNIYALPMVNENRAALIFNNASRSTTASAINFDSTLNLGEVSERTGEKFHFAKNVKDTRFIEPVTLGKLLCCVCYFLLLFNVKVCHCCRKPFRST